MATNFCSQCKKEHPGRECDLKDGECAETKELVDVPTDKPDMSADDDAAPLSSV